MFLCLFVLVGSIPLVFGCTDCQPCECQMIQKHDSKIYQCFANCSGRGLLDIPNSVPSDVEIFDLSNNFLDEKALKRIRGFTEYLVDLRLSFNNFTNILPDTFSMASLLQEITLDDNVLDYVDNMTLGSLKQLRKLHGISSHKYEDNSFEHLTGLDHLSISFEANDINENILKHLKLKTLYVDFKTATTIPENIFNFGDDTLLEIKLNAPNAQSLPEDLFSGLTILKTITITSKKLYTLPSFIFHSDDADNRKMPVNLNKIVIDGVKSLPRNLLDKQQSLKHVSLNNIEDLILPYTASQVDYLDLSGSEVYRVSPGWFESFKSVRYLNLSKTILNELSSSSFDHLSSLTVLDLSHNQINDLPKGLFETAQNTIEILNISNNYIENITEFSLGAVKSLQKLDIGHNKIKSIHKDSFINQHMLEEIMLNDNELVYLSSDTLMNQSRLLDLNIARNHLRQIPANLFRNTRFLKKLDISGNDIETLPHYLFQSVNRLEFVSLGNNPVHCDCSLMKMRDTMPRLNLIGECQEPPELKGTFLKNLKSDDRCLITSTTSVFSTSFSSTPSLPTQYYTAVLSTSFESLESGSSSVVYPSSFSSAHIEPTSTQFFYSTIFFDTNLEEAKESSHEQGFVGSHTFYIMVACIGAVFIASAVVVLVGRARRKMRSRAYEVNGTIPDTLNNPDAIHQ